MRPVSSRHRSKPGRDRNGGTRRPAPGSGRTERGGQWPASAIPVNAEVVSTRRISRAILARHPYPVVRVWGSTLE